MQTLKLIDIDYIKTACRTRGSHFFEAGTMRWFRSRVLETVYQGPGGYYFVTSEQFHSMRSGTAPRAYTVRKFDIETGDIDTVGEFNEMTKYQAQKQARQLAEGGE